MDLKSINDTVIKINVLTASIISILKAASVLGLTQMSLIGSGAISQGEAALPLLILAGIILLYLHERDELKKHPSINIILLGIIILSGITLFGMAGLPTVTEKPISETSSIVIGCSCYLQNPLSYEKCVNGLIPACDRVSCTPGQSVCNIKYLWFCNDEGKFDLHICDTKCNIENTDCETPMILREKCVEGQTKCKDSILYICEKGYYRKLKECIGGCNYAGTDCAVDISYTPVRV